MSYILDALRRADAERERGRVPGIHSQVSPRAPVTSGAVRARRRRRAALPWVLAAAVLSPLVIALVWWFARPASDAPNASAVTTGATASGPVASAPAVLEPARPPSAPQAPAKPSPAPQVAAEPVRPILAPAPAEPPAPAPAPAPRPAPAAEPPRLADLSPEARAQVPAMQVSGSTYSDNPALRMLIINGKVVQEGQDIAPELKLESIAPRTAVVNHRGQRYRISH